MKTRIQTAEAYHRATSYERNRLTPHRMDWPNQPRVVKDYPTLPRVALDRRVELPEIDFFSLGDQHPGEKSRSSSPIDLQQLRILLRLAHDITAVAMHAKTPFYYRSVASAGALYPFELYLNARHIRGVAPGIYHYDPLKFGLTTLREGLLPSFPPVAQQVAATFYLSGIFFRSAWKYRSRAYRYVLLDAGHLMENLRLALKGLLLSFDIQLDFEDDLVSTLLGLDPQKEVCLAAVHLYPKSESKTSFVKLEPSEIKKVEPLDPRVLRASVVAEKEVEYAPILDFHQAGKKISTAFDDLTGPPEQLRGRECSWLPLDLSGPPDGANYGGILQTRRSSRNFIHASDAGDDFKTVVGQLFRHMGKGSGMPDSCRSAVSVGLLLGEVGEVDPGFYLMDSQSMRLGLVAKGFFLETMSRACLDQLWLKNAALQILFFSDLAILDRRWGARGYRYAMIEAGRLGQLAYLAATAVGWGACGIGAIYDREAAELLNLSSSEALLYLVGVGPVKKRKKK
jgi:SagB-type dehydrogenase family enzyme